MSESLIPAPAPVTLTVHEWTELRAAVHAVQDAVHAAEIAAAEAKVSVGRAVASQTALVRRLAERYPGLDPDRPLRLGPGYTLTHDEA